MVKVLDFVQFGGQLLHRCPQRRLLRLAESGGGLIGVGILFRTYAVELETVS